jgi:predicted metalloendopeptidase
MAVMLLVLASLNTITAQVKPTTGKLGIDVSGMDRSVRPQDDFFRYVNGYKAFDVDLGDKLYRMPKDRVKIW